MTGKLVVDALSDRGFLAAWTPSVADGAERLRRRAGPATCSSCSAPATSTGLPTSCEANVARVEERVALSRFTTIGTGGPARWFARPESVDDLR